MFLPFAIGMILTVIALIIVFLFFKRQNQSISTARTKKEQQYQARPQKTVRSDIDGRNHIFYLTENDEMRFVNHPPLKR